MVWLLKVDVRAVHEKLNQVDLFGSRMEHPDPHVRTIE